MEDVSVLFFTAVAAICVRAAGAVLVYAAVCAERSVYSNVDEMCVCVCVCVCSQRLAQPLGKGPARTSPMKRWILARISAADGVAAGGADLAPATWSRPDFPGWRRSGVPACYQMHHLYVIP